MTSTVDRMKLVIIGTVSAELADSFANSAEVDIYILENWVKNEMTVRIKQIIAGRIADEVTVSYPSDWWQAVRERWLPGWAKRKWPVHKTTIRLTARELYPKMVLPEGVIHLEKMPQGVENEYD